MALLTQTRFPRLWEWFQYWIGGTVDKRALCVRHWDRRARVLEVGCSLGNIAKGFARFDGVRYTGVDVDPVVIERARRTFSERPNFEFRCEDLTALPRNDEGWGYVLFAGLCHHVDDAACVRLLGAARELLAADGVLCVVDPLLPRVEDSWFVQQFVKLEQGEFMRSGEALRDVLGRVAGLELVEGAEHLIGASPFHRPVCARFGVYRLRAAPVESASASART